MTDGVGESAGALEAASCADLWAASCNAASLLFSISRGPSFNFLVARLHVWPKDLCLCISAGDSFCTYFS